MKEWIVDSGLIQNRIAILEEGILQELILFESGGDLHAGAICVGRVINTLPDLSAAFVDIGSGKNAFLHEDNAQTEIEVDRNGVQPIHKAVRAGNMILVQIVHPETGSKGAVVTRKISIPGRRSVLLPQSNAKRVSRKIKDKSKKIQLEQLLEEVLPAGMGAIVRTDAEQADVKDVRTEVQSLLNQYRKLEQDGRIAVRPKRLDQRPFPLDALQARLSTLPDRVTTDDPAVYGRIQEWLQAFELVDQVECSLEKNPLPVFEARRVSHQLSQAMERTQKLPGGGTLVVDQTEAMTVVDVNTGSGSVKQVRSGIRMKTNIEALRKVSALMRIRNLSGIILIDLIDVPMDRRKSLLSQAKAILEDDSRVQVHDLTKLCLLEVTRKKAGASPASFMTVPCSACDGAGVRPAAAYGAEQLYKRLKRIISHAKVEAVALTVSPELSAWLGDPSNGFVKRVMDEMGMQLLYTADLKADTTAFTIETMGSVQKVQKYIEKNWLL